jgi:hypothetical protein
MPRGARSISDLARDLATAYNPLHKAAKRIRRRQLMWSDTEN